MTEQSKPKAAPARRNPPRPTPQMRDQQARLDAGAKVAQVWEQMCREEAIAAELFTPAPLREALGALVKANAS